MVALPPMILLTSSLKKAEPRSLSISISISISPSLFVVFDDFIYSLSLSLPFSLNKVPDLSFFFFLNQSLLNISLSPLPHPLSFSAQAISFSLPLSTYLSEQGSLTLSLSLFIEGVISFLVVIIPLVCRNGQKGH